MESDTFKKSLDLFMDEELAISTIKTWARRADPKWYDKAIRDNWWEPHKAQLLRKCYLPVYQKVMVELDELLQLGKSELEAVKIISPEIQNWIIIEHGTQD